MTILQGIVQAIVQGLTEFLPVSSSGHLSLLQHFFGISGESSLLFSVILHFGTLVAVFIAFRELIWELILEVISMFKDLFTGKFSFKRDKVSPNRWYIFMLFISLVPLLFFYQLSGLYERIATDNDIIAEGVCFLVTAILLYFTDKVVKGHKGKKDINLKDALIIGTMQGIAPLPGVSRSGSTIATGIFCGLSMETAVGFSFIMGIPPILAGGLLELKDAIKAPDTDIGGSMMVMIVGFIVAAVVGLLAIRFVKWLAASNRFRIFAYYTCILGIVTILLGIIEAVTQTPIASFFK